MQDVENFAHKYELQEILPELRKGALAAQSPALFESMPELDDSDKALLRFEIEHRWKQPKILYAAIVLSSIAAAIQGWDQTGSNGANLSFPDAFGIPETGPDCEADGSCETNQWLVGVINSMPYFAIFFLSVCHRHSLEDLLSELTYYSAAWISDPLNHLFGRRWVIFVAAIFSVCAPIGMACTQNWQQLIGTRILLGTQTDG